MKVNEIFGPTIQGEGKSAGSKVVFLRLTGCNLACSWCDTPYTWNWIGTKFEHPDKYNREEETHIMDVDEIVHQLESLSSDVRRLVITGGEPLLQQNELIELLIRLGPEWFVEIETNGTVTPRNKLLNLVDQINCSPKTSNSGNRLQLRERQVALRKLTRTSKCYFKFVVRYADDLLEVLDLVTRYRMKNVYLMPEGKTKKEQLARGDEVKEMCRAHGFEFSPRLHVLKWGNTRAT